MNNVGYFEIQADDTNRAITFYTSIFGWKFMREELVPIEYWQIQSEGINGGLLKRPAKTPPPQSGTNAFVCSVQVKNFDDTAKRILEAGGQIALEKFAIPGKCWQGYFLDPDGNTFGLFQVDEQAK